MNTPQREHYEMPNTRLRRHSPVLDHYSLLHFTTHMKRGGLPAFVTMSNPSTHQREGRHAFARQLVLFSPSSAAVLDHLGVALRCVPLCNVPWRDCNVSFCTRWTQKSSQNVSLHRKSCAIIQQACMPNVALRITSDSHCIPPSKASRHLLNCSVLSPGIVGNGSERAREGSMGRVWKIDGRGGILICSTSTNRNRLFYTCHSTRGPNRATLIFTGPQFLFVGHGKQQLGALEQPRIGSKSRPLYIHPSVNTSLILIARTTTNASRLMQVFTSTHTLNEVCSS